MICAPEKSLAEEHPLQLWPHQTAAVDATLAAIDRGVKSGLIVAPTGAGKSVTFATVAHRLATQGWGPTLVLCHRDELIGQAVGTFERVWAKAELGVVKGQNNDWLGVDVCVASVQSLHAQRLSCMPGDAFDLIVVDEAHHCPAATWRSILAHFDSRFVLGATATPDRLDGKGLAELFGDRPIHNYPIRSAIADGVLCGLRQFGIETDTSLDDVRITAGDFAIGQLGQAVNTHKRNEIVRDAYLEHASDRRAIAFCVDVQHAVDLAATFNDTDVTASVVHGNMRIEDRRETIARFQRGEFRVLSNCQIATEGYDDPAVSAILMARPTQSRGLYQQCVGRGLRRHPGKADCMVLDFTDNSLRHKLITCLDLFGRTTKTNADGEDVVATVDHEAQEQESAVSTLFPVTWRLERRCPWPAVPSLKGHVATRPWHLETASEKQVKFVRSFGLEVTRGISKGETSYLIDRAMEFRAAHPEPPSKKQEWCLRHYGQWHNGLTRNEARVLIGKLKRGERVA